MRPISIPSFLRITVYVLLLLFVAFENSSRAFAQDPTPTDDEVNRIAKQLFCPVCESTPLDVCPTEACRQWRDLIRQMLSEGRNEVEIKQYFVAQYGVRVLNEPPDRFAAYIIPVTAFLLGAFLLFRGFRIWIKPVGKEAGSIEEEVKPIPKDDYIQKMEEELKKRN
jgi:cytochrome c-type biogenesis protein CcmH